MNDIHEPDYVSLFSLASSQAGYFTTPQAAEHGVSWRALTHQTSRGRFQRVRRALYRFRDYPSSVHEEVMAAWLAVGANRSIISHESALELHDLTDVIPHSIHLTVDRSLRGLRPLASVTLHTTVHVLPDADVTIREGMRVTSPERSLLDAAAAGTAPEQIVLGVRTAIQRGWASPSGISQRAQARGGRVAHLVQVALREEGAHA